MIYISQKKSFVIYLRVSLCFRSHRINDAPTSLAHASYLSDSISTVELTRER